MVRAGENEKPSERPEQGRLSPKVVSDREVVSLCIEGRRDAWEEFFNRFSPEVRRAIEHTLAYSSDLDPLEWKFEETVWDINEKIVRKFCQDGILCKCTDPSGIRPWLKTVAVNQALTWLRERRLLKNLPKLQTEEGMRSLDEPLFDDSGITLGDTITEEADIDRAGSHYLQTVLGEIERLDNRRDYWIVRLSLVAVLPLTTDEAGDLAAFSPLPEEVVREMLERIVDAVEERDAERSADLGRGVLLWHQLRRLEWELREASRDTSSAGMEKSGNLLEEIARKAKRREQMLAAGKKIPRPSNRDLASLVGIADEQYVSTILGRVRKEIGR